MSGHSAPAQAANKKPSVKSAPAWVFLLLIIFIAIVVIFTMPNDIRRNPSEDNLSKADESTEMIIPNEYVEYHLLKKGADSIMINIPKGYTCDYYGGGKKYYHQAQNGPKEIWGGKKCPKNSNGQEIPTGLGNPEARYAYISYYEEEITVMCEFKKKKQ